MICLFGLWNILNKDNYNYYTELNSYKELSWLYLSLHWRTIHHRRAIVLHVSFKQNKTSVNAQLYFSQMNVSSCQEDKGTHTRPQSLVKDVNRIFTGGLSSWLSVAPGSEGGMCSCLWVTGGGGPQGAAPPAACWGLPRAAGALEQRSIGRTSPGFPAAAHIVWSDSCCAPVCWRRVITPSHVKVGFFTGSISNLDVCLVSVLSCTTVKPF